MDDAIIQQCSGLARRKNVILLLVTEGGDPDAAFRISRCFQNMYEKFICIVPSYCKSAGTLMVIGAGELVMCNAGEARPLGHSNGQKRRDRSISVGTYSNGILQGLARKVFLCF